MKRQLLICLLLLVVTSSTSFFCRNAFTAEEELREQQAKDLILSKISDADSEHFFFQKLVKYLQGDFDPFEILLSKASERTSLINKPYLNKLYIIGVVLLLLYTLSLVFTLPSIAPFCKKIKLRKVFHTAMIAFIVIALGQSIIGVNETGKQQKSLNTFMCRLLKGPQGFILSNSSHGQSYQALQDHIVNIKDNIYLNLRMPVSDLTHSLQQSKQLIPVLQFILTSIQDSQPSKSFVEQVKSFKDMLLKLQNRYSNGTINRCHKQLYEKLGQMIQFVDRMKEYTNAIADDKVSQVSVSTIIRYILIPIKLFFVAIIVALIALSLVICYKKGKEYLLWIQSLLATMAFVCMLLYLSTGFLKPHLLWANSSTVNMALNGQNALPIYQQLFSEKAIISYNQQFFDFSTCLAQSEQIALLLKPYYSKNEEYVQNLYLESLNKSTTEKKVQLQKMVQSYEARRLWQPALKSAYEFFVFFNGLFAPGGDINVINPNAFADYLREVLTVFTVHALNRVYSLSQIFYILSLGLIVISVFTTFASKEDIEEAFSGTYKGVEKVEIAEKVPSNEFYPNDSQSIQ